MSFHRKKKTNYNSSGFTLIELMVTIAIVGLVSAIAIGGYLSWKPGHVLRSAVSQVRGDLNRAKMRAVETRRQCRVVFFDVLTPNGYRIEDGNEVMNSNQWGIVDANGGHTAGTPFRTGDLNNFAPVSLVDGGGNVIVVGTEPTIAFSPRGTATLGSLQIVHPTAGTVTIAVNITGRINITWP